MDELRAPLVTGLTNLAERLALGDLGDPHVGFVVLVHPDREPSVVAITDARPGEHDLSVLRARKASTSSAPASRFFSTEDLGEAVQALEDAELGMKTHRERGGDVELGIHLACTIRDGWARRRARSVQRTLVGYARRATDPGNERDRSSTNRSEDRNDNPET